MTRILRLPAVTLLAALLSCSNSHLIVDKKLRNEIREDYQARVELYSQFRGDLFGIADTVKDNARREAAEFLLAYMPLSDLAVYQPESLLAEIDGALRTRKEMPWGP